MKIPFDLKPMPEEESDALMEQVGKLMENGDRIPQEVTNELLYAQAKKVYNLSVITRNTVRSNWIAIRVLSGAVIILFALLGILHGGDVKDFVSAVGP
jgi:hypothetical protein